MACKMAIGGLAAAVFVLAGLADALADGTQSLPNCLNNVCFGDSESKLLSTYPRMVRSPKPEDGNAGIESLRQVSGGRADSLYELAVSDQGNNDLMWRIKNRVFAPVIFFRTGRVVGFKLVTYAEENMTANSCAARLDDWAKYLASKYGKFDKPPEQKSGNPIQWIATKTEPGRVLTVTQSLYSNDHCDAVIEFWQTSGSGDAL